MVQLHLWHDSYNTIFKTEHKSVTASGSAPTPMKNCGCASDFRNIINPLTLILLTWKIWWTPNNASKLKMGFNSAFKGLNAELNPICHLLSLLGAHHIFHVSGLRVKIAFFISLFFLVWPLLTTQSRCRGLLLHLTTLNDTHTHTHTLGRVPLDEWSARRRDLYLTTYNTRKRQKSMPAAGFEPAIPASERPQTHALDHAATRIFFSSSHTTKYRLLPPLPTKLNLQDYKQSRH